MLPSLAKGVGSLLHCRCTRQHSQRAWQCVQGSYLHHAGFSAAASGGKYKIIMKGLVFHGYHGAYREENVLGQKFVVDAVLWADLARAGQSDQLDDTIDYSKVYKEIQQVVEGPARALQEAVAEDVCQRLLQLDQRISAVQCYLRKPHAPIQGVLESVGVEVTRTRQA